MKKLIFIILISLVFTSCLYDQDYYTDAEIAYKMDKPTIDESGDITINGYFENVGNSKNIGVKKIIVRINLYKGERSEFKYLEYKKNIDSFVLGVDDKKEYQFVVESEVDLEWSVDSFSSEVYFY